MKKIAILGAGISGLTLAYRLQKQYGHSAKIVLFEKSNRVGGWIQTVEKQGFLFECGPRSLRCSGAETFRLIEELGLIDEITLPDPSCRKRYLFQNGDLHEVNLFRSSLFWKGLMRDLMTRKGVKEDETIFSFVSRRFGEAFAKTYVDPLVKGIFAGDIHQLSLKSCFPKLFQAENRYRSVSLGSFFLRDRYRTPQILKGAPLYSFKKGLKTLPEALFKRLNIEVRFGETLKNTFEFDHVFSTIPSYALYELIQDEALLKLPFNSVSTVSFGFHKRLLLKKQGFGYLVPSSENTPILGCVFDSTVFPEQNLSSEQTRLTFMILGTHFSDEELFSLAGDALSTHLGVDAKPDVVHSCRSERAIAQYPVNYDRAVKTLKAGWPSITFLGSSFSGVSVNECIKATEKISLH